MSRDQKKTPVKSLRKRTVTIIVSWVRENLLKSVMLGLFVSWIAISWMVYLVEKGAPDAQITTFGKALWWGIVTFMTVGYGDLTPVTAFGRIWAGSLMFVGVFGVAIVTSKISSYFMEQSLREGRGAVNTQKLKDHFIVCGWKEEMEVLLTHILDFNPGMASSDVVMVANVTPQEVENLRAHPRLSQLHVISGNYFDVLTLKRSAPERARKVLILADRTRSAGGAIPSMTEVDARTVMTSMTLSNIARGTLITAEILDPKMDQYLKIAGVSEIIYSREYSRLLLGNASGGNGISNILYDLLDPKTPARIVTHPIPEKFLGHPYSGLKAEFEAMYPGSAVVGILENTGNSHRIKELALRQAQKTPDVSKLVANLRGVRDLRCNHPIFNPAAEYVVLEGSMAIVIENNILKGALSGNSESEAAA